MTRALTLAILATLASPGMGEVKTAPKQTAVKPPRVSMDFWITEGQQPIKLPPTLANVSYGDHELQVLDFWKADSVKPTPLVFFIHGGSWRSNDKDKVTGLREYLPAGISVVSINYRFTQQAEAAGVKPPVKWPLEDAARALQFVRSKAKDWNIDKTRIGASGGSAGGCSSLWLAFHDDMADPHSSDPVARESTRLTCAGVVGAQTTLDPKQMREWIPNSFYGGHAFGFRPEKGDRYSGFRKFLENRGRILPWIRMYSPYELVTPDDPPVYLHYADAPGIGGRPRDPTHSSNFGVKLQEKMQAAGVECHLMHLGAAGVAYPDPIKFLIAKLRVAGP
jgi:acetyl esterase/lipase